MEYIYLLSYTSNKYNICSLNITQNIEGVSQKTLPSNKKNLKTKN